MENNVLKQFEKFFDGHQFDGLFSEQQSGGMLIGGMPLCGQVVLAAKCKKCVFVVSNLADLYASKQMFLSLGKNVGIVEDFVRTPFYSNTNTKAEVDYAAALLDFLNDKIDVLLVLDVALCQNMCDTKNLLKSSFSLEIGKQISRDELLSRLIALDYTKTDEIQHQKHFRLRGEVLELADGDDIVRVEFFDDEIESIKRMSANDFSLLEKLQKFYVYPKSIFISQNQPSQCYGHALQEIDVTKVAKSGILSLENIVDDLAIKRVAQKNNVYPAFMQPFLNAQTNFLGYQISARVFVSNFAASLSNIHKAHQSFENKLEQLLLEGQLLPQHKNYYCNLQTIKNQFSNAISFSTALPAGRSEFDLTVSALKPKQYLNSFEQLKIDVELHLKNTQNKIILFCGNKQNKERIAQFLRQNGIVENEDITSESGLFLLEDYFSKSLIVKGFNLIVFGTDDLVRRTQISSSNKKKARDVFYLPKVGDFVVHEKHGIGKCVELANLKLGQVAKDYFVVEYKNGDKLYVPTEQVDMLSAYVGSSPTLSKIGGAEFAKVKQAVFKKAKALAFDLVALYKERQKKKGFAFDADGDLQAMFENDFEFEETPDQISALCDIKQDMQSSKPMDRLLCGDVGFGKTEVALRAAFKAVLSGKQVAILCPTTILCKQHYQTAKKRFEKYGVNISCLSRFQSTSQTKQIVKDLSNGNIDILIGTHKMLAENIKFANLGLLILDEEQRFGVAAKEKIKRMKTDIDVLSMSATPIPRTLHMSLSGIRDISIISTPPSSRIAPTTVVTEISSGLLKSAISTELQRGGQTLVVLNNTKTLSGVAAHISNMFPSARVGWAHGQMQKQMLEKEISRLYDGEFDVFVSTTLIENGIDLPLANTLVVLDSDKMGLSQLYQLRGRVGRSNIAAYAYFTYESEKMLSQDALSRLEALSQNAQLGSGFKIAMRDLQIRGAGNILGSEQSGQMAKVGYDLYCKILSQAAAEIDGESKNSIETKLDVDVAAYIDKSVVENEDERIKLYVEIGNISSSQALCSWLNKFEHSYGKLSQNISNLAKIGLLKNICKKHEIINVKLSNNYFYIKLNKNNQKNIQKILDKLSEYSIAYELAVENEQFKINLKTRKKSLENDLNLLLDILQKTTN